MTPAGMPIDVARDMSAGLQLRKGTSGYFSGIPM